MYRGLILLFLLPLLAACGAGGPAGPTLPPQPTWTAPVNVGGPAATNTSAPLAATKPPAAAPATATLASPTKPAPPATATQAAGKADVHITQVVSYTDSLGGFTIIGLVENASKGTAINIKVRGEADDANGDAVGNADDFLLALVWLPPGGKAPFSISMSKPTGKPAKVSTSVTSDTYDPAGFNIFLPAQSLTIEGNKFAAAEGFNLAKATGRVKNGGSKPAELVSVLAAGYDAAGALLDVTKVPSDPTMIAAGSAAPFTATFYRPKMKIVKVDLLPVGNEKKQ